MPDLGISEGSSTYSHELLITYTHKKKYWPSRDFSRQISTVLGNFLKKYLRYRSFIYLIGKPYYPAFRNFINKGCGSFNKSATPL